MVNVLQLLCMDGCYVCALFCVSFTHVVIMKIQPTGTRNKNYSFHYIFSSSTTYDRSTMHPKLDPTGVQTHDLQIMTVHFMSLRRKKPSRST